MDLFDLGQNISAVVTAIIHQTQIDRKPIDRIEVDCIDHSLKQIKASPPNANRLKLQIIEHTLRRTQLTGPVTNDTTGSPASSM
jgi:hypothetical protein